MRAVTQGRIGDLDELLAAVQTVDARADAASSLLRNLTTSELDVLREMAQSKNNAGVAAALHLSESAVEKHVSSIFLKLGVHEGSRSADASPLS